MSEAAQLPNIPHRVFAFWLGPPMNETRRIGLESLVRTGAPVVLVTASSLRDWILPGEPVHPAWRYLSAIHQADDLRAYFMHHYGGGYSDIKPTTRAWDGAFAEFADPSVFAVGYPEVGRHGVAAFDLEFTGGRYQPWRTTWWRYRWLQLRYRALVGNCAYIVRPKTTFTQRWLDQVHRTLDRAAPLLEAHPATHPKERRGATYEGEVSQYPMSWAGVHADVFHPLVYRYRRHIRQALPPPSFANYQ